GASDPQLGQAIGEARRLLDTILRSVRDLVMGLRPSMLDDFGLQPALEWHVRDFRRRFGIPVDLSLGGDLDSLPDQYRTAVYRIVQEALTNCARHASAKQIDVRVHLEQNTLELRVADDGTGIAPDRIGGVGLIGIEERVRELHGVFHVGPRKPRGTELHVTLPITTSIGEAKLARAAG
ncbi:MAG TPA: ATP-binding protein, partial [Thermoanaerobaculia bacterium]|nr:ATP-binding protein [Thermoanaerobaculia bacterium]